MVKYSFYTIQYNRFICYQIVQEKSVTKNCSRKFDTLIDPFQAGSTKICLQVGSSHWTTNYGTANKKSLIRQKLKERSL